MLQKIIHIGVFLFSFIKNCHQNYVAVILFKSSGKRFVTSVLVLKALIIYIKIIHNLQF